MCFSRRRVPSSSARYEDSDDTLCSITDAIMNCESSLAISHAAAITFSSGSIEPSLAPLIVLPVLLRVSHWMIPGVCSVASNWVGWRKGFFVQILLLSMNWQDMGTALGDVDSTVSEKEKNPVSPLRLLNCVIISAPSSVLSLQ